MSFPRSEDICTRDTETANPRDICRRDTETANPRVRKEDFSFLGGTNLPTCLREEMTTAAPSSARRRAIAKPIPCVDAVITATLPSNLLGRTALPISLLAPTTSRKSTQKNTDLFYNKKRISTVSSASFIAVFKCTTTPSPKLRNWFVCS